MTQVDGTNGHAEKIPVAELSEEKQEFGNPDVLKTYKLYIGGKYPRTESGRYIKFCNPEGKVVANICRGSRKDFRQSVEAARAAQSGWAARSAYNRGQILYRIAEMMQGRSDQFIDELTIAGMSAEEAKTELDAAIELFVHYAGWADKYQQVLSAVNPVASSHFNFSMPEPMGVIAAFAPVKSPLAGLAATVAPAIVGGNTIVVLASEENPLCSITLAEVFGTSDLPGGVVNILTGFQDELAEHFAGHMDVNALIFYGTEEDGAQLHKLSAENLKRFICRKADLKFDSEQVKSPYLISDTQETKTTWHPIGK